jgi:hypothetical protein
VPYTHSVQSAASLQQHTRINTRGVGKEEEEEEEAEVRFHDMVIEVLDAF